MFFRFRICHSSWTRSCALMIRFHSTQSQFSSLELSRPIQKALSSVFKFDTMTPVQAKVLEQLPLENNILVRSKTGTGKTLSFLIAALQSTDAFTLNNSHGFKVVIVAPTRELAIQIHQEAKQLCQFSPLICHVLTGGADKNRQLAKMKDERTDILVCTAGRMVDLLENVPNFSNQLSNVKAFILDEVDRLLDIGMKDDIEKIATYMPSDRLNLLFSATLEEKTKAIAKKLCGKFDYIDCVDKTVSEVPLPIEQKCMLVPYRDSFNALAKLISDHRNADPCSKIIVFFQTTKLTQFAADIFYRFEGLTVNAIHSGLRQQQRERVSQRFRESTGGILFTSDVSARGVDYPNIGLVIQMGMPVDRDTYIHRMGRTGRAGKDGKCVLVLPPIEKPFLRELNDMPIEFAETPKLFEPDSKQMKQIERGIMNIPEEQREEIFHSVSNGAKSCWGKLSVSKNLHFRALEEMATKCLMLETTPQALNQSSKKVGHSFHRDGEQRHDGSRRSFYQEKGHERRPFNRDGPFERRPFNRDGPSERRPFKRDGPFERRSFNSQSSDGYKNQGRSESKFKFKHTFESVN